MIKSSGIGSIYESTHRGEAVWMVQAGEVRGFGDWIFHSKDEAEKAGAREYADFLDKEKRKEAFARQAAEELANKNERENLNGFDANMTPRQRGLTVKLLTRQFRYEGGVYSRRDLIRKLVSEGRVVETEDGERRLVSHDGLFLGEKILTQVGLDYAEWLLKIAIDRLKSFHSIEP